MKPAEANDGNLPTMLFVRKYLFLTREIYSEEIYILWADRVSLLHRMPLSYFCQMPRIPDETDGINRIDQMLKARRLR